MTNNPPPPSKGSINSSKLPSLTRESTAPAAGDAKQKKNKRERGMVGWGWGEGKGVCQDQLRSLPVVPFWARPQRLKWLGLCFGERLGGRALLRLGGKGKDVCWLEGGTAWGGSCFTPHVMRSTSAARQCRVWNDVTLGCCIDVDYCMYFDLASMFLSLLPVSLDGAGRS